MWSNLRWLSPGIKLWPYSSHFNDASSNTQCGGCHRSRTTGDTRSKSGHLFGYVGEQLCGAGACELAEVVAVLGRTYEIKTDVMMLLQGNRDTMDLHAR